MKPLLPVLLLGLLALLPACSKTATSDAPAAISRSDVCALDGMTLTDYPGPKGQIVFTDGKRDFFCDTTELLATLLKPEQKRAMRGAYVQDMARTPWDKPQDAWIDARTAFYVQGSKKTGSMGPTLASFARREDADAFAKQEGGKVLAFAAITPERLGSRDES